MRAKVKQEANKNLRLAQGDLVIQNNMNEHELRKEKLRARRLKK